MLRDKKQGIKQVPSLVKKYVCYVIEMFVLRYICPIGMMTWLKTKIISYICIEKKTLGISIQMLVKLILEQWYYEQFYFSIIFSVKGIHWTTMKWVWSHLYPSEVS